MTEDVAAPITKGSAAGEGVSYPGRRKEDDVNLVTTPSVVSPAVTAKWAKQSGGPAGDEAQNLTVTHTLRSEGFDASEDGTGRGTPMVVTEARTLADVTDDELLAMFPGATLEHVKAPPSAVTKPAPAADVVTPDGECPECAKLANGELCAACERKFEAYMRWREKQEQGAVPIQDGRELEKEQNGLGVGSEGDPSYTLDTTGAQAVFSKARRTHGEDGDRWEESDEALAVNPMDLRYPGNPSQVAFVKKHGANTAEDHETWAEDDTARALNGMGQAGTNGALVAQPQAFHAYHGYEQPPDGVQTLMGSDGHPSLHDAPILLEQQAFNVMPEHGQGADLQATETDEATGIDVTGLSRSTDRGTRVVTESAYSIGCHAGTEGEGNARPAGMGIRENEALAVRADRRHAVATPQSQRIHDGDGVAPTLTSDSSEARGGTEGPKMQVAGDVRRLTPTETERLQSLPDGWTYDWGPSLRDAACEAFSGRLRASEGQACPVDYPPDGPRYAACGDAVTSNVAEWIADRVARVRASA